MEGLEVLGGLGFTVLVEGLGLPGSGHIQCCKVKTGAKRSAKYVEKVQLLVLRISKRLIQPCFLGYIRHKFPIAVALAEALRCQGE